MKRILRFSVLFVVIFVAMAIGSVSTTLNSCSSELMPTATALASDTANQVEQIKTDSRNVFDEIQDNVDLVAELRAKVQEAQLNNESISLNDMINDIEKVAHSYEKLAGQREDIRKELLTKVAKVDNMRIVVKIAVVSLREKKAGYTEQLRLVSDPDPEIARTRKAALTKAIGYVEQQIQIWEDFGNIEKNIIIEMSDIQERIDSFLSMVESTSIVFKEGLNLLRLQRDINEAVALFSSDIPHMEKLTQDMEDSWQNLDYLLDNLTGVAKLGATK